jgi:D-beta-D-heptose 7-phosphate kinase/D-beta-D-heptose 1-phosphate adenosyltransferase
MNIDASGIFFDSNKTTIRKTRVIGLNQQLLRIDHENSEYIETHLEEIFIEKIKEIIDLSAIIVSDYAKGTITKQLMTRLIQYSKENNILLIVDPKPKHKEWYTGSSLTTPNKKEAQEMSGIIIETKDDFIEAGEILINKFNSDVIITAGADGMYVFAKNNKPIHLETQAKEVYDVSGAGDTVIATLTLALSCGADLDNAATLANQAAGIKVSKTGTKPVFLKELDKEIHEK